MLRRSIWTCIAAVTAGTAAVVGTPGVASASAHVVSPVIVGHETFDVRMYSAIDLAAGDCTLNRGSAVTVSQPDSSGFAVLTWGGIGSSRDPSSSGDIWHLKVVLRDGQGRTILTSATMDSVRMKNANQNYGWTRTQVVRLPAGGYDAAASGVFDSSC